MDIVLYGESRGISKMSITKKRYGYSTVIDVQKRFKDVISYKLKDTMDIVLLLMYRSVSKIGITKKRYGYTSIIS
jgi:hypothetical protein